MAARARAKTKSKTRPRTKAKVKVKPVPAGFHTLTPYLCVRDAPRAIEFYKQAFGAVARNIHHSPDGKVMNADLQVGDSILMLNEEFPSMGALSPLARGGTSVTIHIYCKDVDAAFSKAVAAGAKVKMPVMDMFWGDRYASLEDPFGHSWSIGTHKEDLSAKEIEARGAATFAKMGSENKPGA